MTVSATDLGEEGLATLYGIVVQITGGRNGKTAVPYHELVVLLVVHLFLTTIVLIVKQVFLESVLVSDGWCVQHFIDTCGNAFVGTVGIVGMQNAGK